MDNATTTTNVRERTVPTALWIVAFGLAAAACGLVYDAVWSMAALGVCLLAGVVLGLSLISTIRGRNFAERIRAMFQGACLGIIAWLFSLFSWYAVEIALGGRVSRLLQIVLGAVFGAVIGWCMAWIARPPADARRARRRRWIFAAGTTLLFFLLVGFITFAGPRAFSRYPSAEQSPYRLPWPGGRTFLCCQGNRGVVSHRGDEEFAYDFAMPVGSDVCAARAGIVVWIEVGNDGNGRHAPNNFVVIDHGDGTFGWYVHLRRDGSYVQPNQSVRQGERIAASGNVGLSMLPHLHFQVSNTHGETLPVTFAEVDSDRGIPRMFKRYTSGNSP